MANGFLRTMVVGCTLLLCSCGGSVELRPEIATHLDGYEQLIEEFESKFDAVRNDPPAFAKVAESYRQKTETWMNELTDIAPDISDDEGKAIGAAVDKLNKRAIKMLTVG